MSEPMANGSYVMTQSVSEPKANAKKNYGFSKFINDKNKNKNNNNKNNNFFNFTLQIKSIVVF